MAGPPCGFAGFVVRYCSSLGAGLEGVQDGLPGHDTGIVLPKFVLVGVPRSGTTSLYQYLGQHPQICLSEIKEVNFLSYPGEEVARRDFPRMRFPVRSLEEYGRLFADAGSRVPVDFSASCFRSAVAIDRIRQFLPDGRFFVVLRDPVGRAYSAYLNRVAKGYESRSPDVALVPGDVSVDNGFYSERIAAFRMAFGVERVRVWLFDDLVTRPEATLKEVFGYLGVDSSVAIDTTAVHNRGGVPRSQALGRLLPSYARRRQLGDALPGPLRTAARRLGHLNRAPAPRLPEAVERRLRDLYTDEVHRLEELLGRDLDSWI